jgi:hypothetical protein
MKLSYSVKSLLVATTLIAIGAAMLGFLFTRWDPDLSKFVVFLMHYSGGALIGAGVCTPFGYSWVGGAVGLAIMIILPYFLIPLLSS